MFFSGLKNVFKNIIKEFIQVNQTHSNCIFRNKNCFLTHSSRSHKSLPDSGNKLNPVSFIQ